LKKVTKLTKEQSEKFDRIRKIVKDLYDPVSLDFYQKLEVFIKREKPVRIWYRNEKGFKQKTDTVIREIVGEENAEWIITENGLRIRADKLIEVGGVLARIPIFGLQYSDYEEGLQ
jgi:regulator of protease activity HflC (stomatin/prohibitin superfamily)